MKHSDIVAESVTGKFLNRARGRGTITEQTVITRAKELAVMDGRNSNDFTQDDLDAARRDLQGLSTEESQDDHTETPNTGSWGSEAVDRGHKTPVRAAADEQIFAEHLVQEGLDEAAHDQALAGSQTTLKTEK